MLPASLFFALPLLVHTTAASGSDVLGCSNGPGGDVSDDQVRANIDSHVNAQLPASSDHVPPQAQPKDQAQDQVRIQDQVQDDGQPKPIVHVHAHVHGPAHDHAHIRPNPPDRNRGNGGNRNGTETGSDKPVSGQRSHSTYNSGYAPSTETTAVGRPSAMASPSLSHHVAPDGYSVAALPPGASASPSSSDAPAKPSPGPPRGRSQGRMNGLYFTNWNVKEANFDPEYVEAKGITHAIYAFADIGTNGIVKSMDPWFDVDKRWSGDVPESGKNAYGCIKRLFILKKRNRNLKTLLSIGGWSASNDGKFSAATATKEGRKAFAKSAVKLATDWGMDGLDIDWESPSNPEQAEHLVLLLRECRSALDAYAAEQGQSYHYLLTAATPAGPQNYRKMNLTGMDTYLDIWNIMSYDFAGSWDSTTGHQANLFADLDNPLSTKASANQSVRDYIAAGVSPRKINLGVPLYGRSFTETRGLGAPYKGTSGKEGTWSYRDLPRPGAKNEYSEKLVASWSYSEDSGELVSYDTVQSIKGKARYILDQHLGGAFFWEASGDKSGSDSLVGTMAASLGSLDETENMLKYPDSQYDNIRNCMPGVE